MASRTPRRMQGWPLWAALVLVVASGVAIAVASGVVVWWGLGHPSLNPYTSLATGDLLEIVRIALFITGGLGGVMALVVTYRRQRVAEDANERSEETESREHTKLNNERFAAAAKLLGDPDSVVRLGGVYALSALADDWPAQRQACINLLCGYLRMPYHHVRGEAGWREGDRETRLSIVSVIRDHLRPDAADGWHEQRFDFTGATFDGGDFSGVELRQGEISFRQAEFIGRVSFEGMCLDGARLDFDGATFSAGEVSFAGSQLRRGGMSFALTGFSGATVSFLEAAFAGATVAFAATVSAGKVSFDGATFDAGDLMFDGSTVLDGSVTFENAHLLGGSLSFGGTTVAAGRVSFAGADLDGAVIALDNVTVSGGVLSFEFTKLRSGDVRIGALTVAGGRLSFEDAQFLGGDASFVFATLSDGALSFDRITLSGGSRLAFIDARFDGTDVSFVDASLAGGRLDLPDPETMRRPPRFALLPEPAPATAP